MASNRIRALRNVSNRLTRIQARLGYLDRRPAPRRLADNFIFTNNIQRVAIVEPLVAPDAITNEKLTDDSVQTDEIELDAMTGKNINSCTITDSTFSNGEIYDSSMNNMTADTVDGSNYTLDTVEGTNFTLETVEIDGLVLVNGEITETTLDGAEVVLTGCTLANCTADTITATSGSLALVGAPVAVSGGFAVVDGSTTMTVAGGQFGVGTGSGTLQLGSGGAEFSGFDWFSFAVSGIFFTPYFEFEAEIERLEGLIDDLQSELDSKAPASHSHPGL